MQGHVDGVGAVAGVREDGFARVVTIEAEPGAAALRRREGLDRRRRRLARPSPRVDDDDFDVSLIPETLRAHEPRRAPRPGTPVNLEVDILAKYVEKLVGPR